MPAVPEQLPPGGQNDVGGNGGKIISYFYLSRTVCKLNFLVINAITGKFFVDVSCCILYNCYALSNT